MFKQNSLECKRNLFSTIGNVVTCLLNVKFENNSPVFLSGLELGARFGVEIDTDSYISLKQDVS